MTSLVNTNSSEIQDLFVQENKKELEQKLETIVGTIDDNLKRLINLYDRVKEARSAQAMAVELEIIQYIDSLRGIKPEPKKTAIQVAVFNYDRKQNLDY